MNPPCGTQDKTAAPLLRRWQAAAEAMSHLPRTELHGKVVSAGATACSLMGLGPWLRLGTRLALEAGDSPVRGGGARAAAFGPLDGIGAGSRARLAPPAALAVDELARPGHRPARPAPRR